MPNANANNERIAALEVARAADREDIAEIKASIVRIEHRLYAIVATGILGGQALSFLGSHLT